MEKVHGYNAILSNIFGGGHVFEIFLFFSEMVSTLNEITCSTRKKYGNVPSREIHFQLIRELCQ